MHSTTLLIPFLLASSTLAMPLSRRQLPTPNSASPDPNLISHLILAATEEDRINLLQPADFVYDFLNPPSAAITKGQGGATVKADRKQFPALIGTGTSVTLGFLGPCGFNTPHVHPRATELNTVVQGELTVAFILENGAQPVTHNLTQFQMVAFPQGAMHTEFNPLCTESIFVAAFDSEDPGVQQTAQTFFNLLETDLITAALGGPVSVAGQDLDQFKSILPHNVAFGVQECLARCNIAPGVSSTSSTAGAGNNTTAAKP